jgi:transcriptional regulator with XRE-family HTH domain
MEAWKQTVAENLASLRREHHMTQLQLAEELHYSDKAVSKWERGESLPDLAVMKQLADLYGITLDDFLLTKEEREAKVSAAAPPPAPEPADDSVPRRKNHNRLIIAGMAMMLVWLIATLIFVVLDMIIPELDYGKFLFLYAAPITAIVLLVFNSIWFNPRWNYAIISALVWSILGAIFLTFYSHRLWKLFLIGIPAQLIILLWSRLKPAEKPRAPQAGTGED